MGIHINPGSPTSWICPERHERMLIGMLIGDAPRCSKCGKEMIKEEKSNE